MTTLRSTSFKLITLVLISLTLVGCKTAKVAEEPEYDRPLGAGKHALRKITDPAKLPNLKTAYERKDQYLDEALAHSLAWFAKPSTTRFYPLDGMTHEQSWGSVYAFRSLLASAGSASEFERLVREDFDTYESVGWNDQGEVMTTGYYSPVFSASRTQTDQYKYPLYKRPADLLSDAVTGEFKGRKMADGSIVMQYPKRSEIESTGMLKGTELVWLKDKFEAYVVGVNGSAQLKMTDGSTMYVGFAGVNGYDYSSVRQEMIKDGKLTKSRANLATMTKYFQENPTDVDTYLNKNDRYVFFKEYSSSDWPAGSLGERVTPLRSLATDKSIFPRGNVTLVNTGFGDDANANLSRFEQFMLDQDTGGAIRAPGRADIYMGVGTDAERWAGHQHAIGQLYYFILKPEKVAKWAGQAKSAAPKGKAGSV